MARTEWAALLATASDANAVQSWAWGEFKRERGWEPERWVARDAGGRIVGCLQALKRSVALGRLIVWVPGGPVLGFAPTAAGLIVEIVATWLEEFRRHNRVVYVRFYSHLPASPEAAYSLSRVVRPVALSINSGFTCLIDLSPSLEELRAAMTAKHRYYVKQSEAAGLDWKFGWSPELARDMVTLHAMMIDAKRLAQTPCDLETMEALERHFGDDIVLLVGYDGGRPVTSCLALTYAGTAFYLLAATSPEGRKTSAAYAMIIRLFEVLKSRGIRRFDFGGLAPASQAAAGVDHFKRGFGGTIVQYLGEWEWSASGFLRWPANLAIRMMS